MREFEGVLPWDVKLREDERYRGVCLAVCSFRFVGGGEGKEERRKALSGAPVGQGLGLGVARVEEVQFLCGRKGRER